jgi:hypothetical protein
MNTQRILPELEASLIRDESAPVNEGLQFLGRSLAWQHRLAQLRSEAAGETTDSQPSFARSGVTDRRSIGVGPRFASR